MQKIINILREQGIIDKAKILFKIFSDEKHTSKVIHFLLAESAEEDSDALVDALFAYSLDALTKEILRIVEEEK